MSDQKNEKHYEFQKKQEFENWLEAERGVLNTNSHREYGFPLLLLLKKPGLFSPEKRQIFHTKLRDQSERYFMLVSNSFGRLYPLGFRKQKERQPQPEQPPQPPKPALYECEIELSQEIVETIMSRIGAMSMPLRVENLAMDWLDGTEHVILVHNWAGQCQFTWNVEAPKEWEALESLFHEVWELGPPDVGPFEK